MSKRKPPPVHNPGADLAAEPSLYHRIGHEKIEQLVAAFYARVDRDPVIRPFYGKTLSCAIDALTKFLIAWLGGPSVYDVRSARLRRRHMPFAIDKRARDAWLANMKAAVREVEIPAAEAKLLLAHLELGAKALVNTGNNSAKSMVFPAAAAESRLTREWNQMADAEELLDAVSEGDLALIRSLLPQRLVPHAQLMCHALADWLDPTGRMDRRYGRRASRVNPLAVIETLLAHRELDLEVEAEELARFLHLEAMMAAYVQISRFAAADWPFHPALRAATRDRFIAQIERDRSCATLVGTRGQTLLHEAAALGEPELAAGLIRCGAEASAPEDEGHTPLYRASTGEVARVLLAAGAAVDATSGPTRGTALHQAARHGFTSVAQALLDHGAAVDAPDARKQTPLHRAVNCRKIEMVRLLIRHSADPHAADYRGATPLSAARSPEMRQALLQGGAPR